MKISLLMGTCAALVLGGCANTLDTSPTAADDPTVKCLQAMTEAPMYQDLYAKIGKSAAVSFEQLANKEFASEDEKRLISAWAADRTACVLAGQDYRAAYAPPGYSTAFNNQQNAIIGLAARLFSGDLTYGQFNQERMRMADSSAREMEHIRQSQIETSDRQLDPVRQQLMIDQMRRAFRPGPSIAPTVNCTTRNIGGTVYTNCR